MTLFQEKKTKAYKTSLAGAPGGEYVLIQFQTSFENKKAAVETVTPMMGKDGVWQVSIYNRFVRYGMRNDDTEGPPELGP